MRSVNSAYHKKLEKIFLDAYDKYSAKILKHIYFRTSDNDLAQDLTSETFTKTWDYLRQGKQIKNFKGFLYRVSNNLIIDYYKSKKRKPIPLENIPEIVNDNWQAAVKIKREFDFNLTKKYFDFLPADYRDILICRFIDELSIKEISRLTGKSIVNIYTIIHRALKTLRQKIKENEK